MNTPENSILERESYIRTAVELAIENGWVANLCKYYNTESALIDKCLESHGKGCVADFKKAFQDTMRNWHAVHAYETGNDEIRRYTNEQIEILMLVSYRYSNKTIAAVKCMTKVEVDRTIAELCTIASVRTKAELEKYAKAIFIPKTTVD